MLPQRPPLYLPQPAASSADAFDGIPAWRTEEECLAMLPLLFNDADFLSGFSYSAALGADTAAQAVKQEEVRAGCSQHGLLLFAQSGTPAAAPRRFLARRAAAAALRASVARGGAAAADMPCRSAALWLLTASRL